MSNKFYVHIVESPSPDELLDGITEGKALCSFLDIAKIPYSYNLAVDLNHFNIAMGDRIWESINKFQVWPILHLSTHGGQDGIQLTNQRDTGDFLAWSYLATYLRSIQDGLMGGIGVCMSCCGGAHGTQMARVIPSNLIPFSWIVGTSTVVDVPDIALAYSIFYRQFHSGVSGQPLIEAMRAGSGITDFGIWNGELIQAEHQNIHKILEQIHQHYPTASNPT